MDAGKTEFSAGDDPHVVADCMKAFSHINCASGSFIEGSLNNLFHFSSVCTKLITFISSPCINLLQGSVRSIP